MQVILCKQLHTNIIQSILNSTVQQILQSKNNMQFCVSNVKISRRVAKNLNSVLVISKLFRLNRLFRFSIFWSDFEENLV